MSGFLCLQFARLLRSPSVRPFPAFSALALDGAAAAVAEEGGRRQSEQTERRGLSAALGLPQISSQSVAVAVAAGAAGSRSATQKNTLVARAAEQSREKGSIKRHSRYLCRMHVPRKMNVEI